jgi:hypothetical protein
LIELSPSDPKPMIRLLVGVLGDPAARKAIRETAMGIDKRTMLMEAAVDAQLPGSTLEQIVPDTAFASGAPEASGLRELRGRMEAEGDYAGLWRLWNRRLGRPASEQSEIPYDGRFRGLPGGPPFNWTLVEAPDGGARRADFTDSPATTGLSVSQSGYVGGIYARQMLLLRPGPYRLQLDALTDWDNSNAEPPFQILLRCSRSGAGLGTLPIPYHKGWRPVTFVFVVPPVGCVAQDILVSARSQEDANPVRLDLTRVAITRVGS